MFHGLSISCPMPCRTQLHHTELHDFSAKRARIQEAPEAQPPDLYLPFWFGTPECSCVMLCSSLWASRTKCVQPKISKRGARVQR